MPETGDWTVDIDDDVPGHVRMYFDEISEDGITRMHTMYLLPDDADGYADAIKRMATYIRENTQ